MRRLVFPVVAVVLALALGAGAVLAFDRPALQRVGQALSQVQSQTHSPDPEAAEPAESPEPAEAPETPETEAED